MRWMSWMVMSIAAIAIMTGCSGNQTETSEESVSDLDEQSIEAVPDGAIASGDSELPPPTPIPYLTPPTSPNQRASQVQVGRPDPFAPLPSSPIVVPARVSSPAPPQPIAQSPTPVPVASSPQLLPPVPFASAPVPIQSPSAASPPSQPQPVAVAPTPPPAISLIDSIEVSGVVQVGGRTSAIVRVPTEQSSRTANVGDRIANGQVLLKRIDMGGGGDPIVILEQNGVEVLRSVSLMGG